MILSGILLTPTGLPMANASVRLIAIQTSEQVLETVAASFSTDESGFYSFDCPLGYYRVTVSGIRSIKDIGAIQVTEDTVINNINELLMIGSAVIPNPILDQIGQVIVGLDQVDNAVAAAAQSAQSAQSSALASQQSQDIAATKASQSTESSAQALASAQASESSAIESQAAVDRLSLPDGSTHVGYESPIGVVFYVAKYLDDNKFFAGSANELQNAIDHSSSFGGGRDVTLLPNVVYDMGAISVNSITMKAAVELKCDTGQAVSVQHLATANPKGLPIIKCGAISNDFFIVPSIAFNSVLRNIIIDARLQVSGDALKYSDTDGVQRTDAEANGLLVYKSGNGAAIRISPNHKEGKFDKIFARCGSGVYSAADGQLGLVAESIDWDFGRVLCGFARERSLLYTGGACRFGRIDAWGSADISAEIQGTSVTFERLQVDGSGNSGLLINGGDDVVINQFISINNCLTASTPADDVIIRGEVRSLSIAQARLRGSSGNIRYGIGMEDTATGIGNIGDINSASSYLSSMNDRARAYVSVGGSTNALSMGRGSPHRVESLTVNPLFTKWTGSLPDGLTARGSATAAQITPSGITTGNYTSGVRITSGAVGVSGLQAILDKDKYKGRRIHVEGWVKGTGLTFLGNQRIQLFDGVGTHVEIIPNDNQWHWIAIDVQMDIAATDVQIRFVAANDATAALPLDMTAIYYWAY